jgi:hypothetical protein
VSNFEYDIVLSFAGEQRQQVEEVAELLKRDGISVFYDKYEEITLWGKDLFQHLSEIYRKKAKFCIVFASKEYAEKSWTNHELKSAQARAFELKEQEYILPVRFDSTEIPGILPTAGYLDFHRHGAKGIARLAALKVHGDSGTRSLVASEQDAFSCSVSKRALLSCSAESIQLSPLVSDIEWGTEIKLSIVAESEDDEAVFSRLHSAQNSFIVAFRFQVAVAKLAAATRRMKDGKAIWSLHFVEAQQDFRNEFEMGMGKVTVEDLARMRVERLLLNSHIFDDKQDQSSLEAMNKAMIEVGIRGLNTRVTIERSKFPLLWPVLKEQPQEFLNIAWIIAVSELKLSAAVEHINKLVLDLHGSSLSIQFSGVRHRKYVNVPPLTIETSGTLQLES